KNKPKCDGNSTKKEIEIFHNWFFHDDPIGKQIAQLAKDWNETVQEAKGKFRASLAGPCSAPFAVQWSIHLDGLPISPPFSCAQDVSR
ncbi:hypothetical protein TSMEX_010802, partial [Taenia solium]